MWRAMLTDHFLASYLGRWGLEEGGRCAWHGEKPSCTRSGDDIAVRGREGDAHEAQPLLHCNSEKFNFCTDTVVLIDCKMAPRNGTRQGIVAEWMGN